MRIVVKVGTSTLAYGTGRLNIRHTEQLVKVLSDLKNEGHEVILVSSGAIGMGVGKLSLPQRPKDTASKQACAAVGQCELMYTYDRLFNATITPLRRSCSPAWTWSILTGGSTSRTPCPACWSWGLCPSSTKTTPLHRRDHVHRRQRHLAAIVPLLQADLPGAC